MENNKFVSQSVYDFLKPKSQEDITNDIKLRLKGHEQFLNIELETPDFIIYKVEKGDIIKDIVRNFSVKDEDIFFNQYLILDNSVIGFKQIIGVKVSPDGTITAMDAKGNKIEEEYLQKFYK